MKIFDPVREYFDKDKIDSVMEEMESQSDYYKGDWGYCGLYMSGLCNFKILDAKPSYINLISYLKSKNCISASINRYSKDTIVYSHTDTDLTGDNNVLRCFIPLEYGYTFEFTGLSIVQDVEVYNAKAKYTSDILFIPQKHHSYSNLEDKDQYFLIVDICEDKTTLTEEFWRHYFHFAIENYL